MKQGSPPRRLHFDKRVVLAVAMFLLGALSRPRLEWIKAGVAIRWKEIHHVQQEPDDAPYDELVYYRKSSQYEALGSTRKIVFLGDSRVEGAEWSEWLANPDISNRGILGDTTSGTLKRLRTSIPHDISLCILELGFNDLNKGCSVNFVVSEYDQILSDLFRRVHARVIIMAILLAGNEHAALNPVISACNRELYNLAMRRGATWIDVNGPLCENGVLSASYTNDGIHLNGAGYTGLVMLLAPYLRR